MAEAPPSSRAGRLAGGALLGAAALAVLLGEKHRPLRRPTQAEPRRSLANLTLGLMSLAVVNLVEKPLTQPLSTRAATRRRGIAQRLPAPAWARDAAAVLLMDYTIYIWHVATHRVPFLWRFHLVHHIDLDLDATTALRFHAADMAISAPYRAAQVAVLGVSPRAFRIWQGWFFLSIWFHHSNLRLPARVERILARIVTTPRMHGIHHSTVRAETESNWSSGFAFWDHLHGTFRLDVPQDAIAIGVPGYRDPAEMGTRPSLRLPFGRERDAWTAPPDGTAVPLVRSPRSVSSRRDRIMNVELLSPSELSKELRTETSADLKRRRIGLGLSFAGAVIGGVVAAYQTGLLKRLPDILPGKLFDAEKVDASDYAYQNLQQPDGPMMLVNYGLTAMTIAAGGKDRAAQNPALPIAAAGKALFDLALCSGLAVQEWRENRKLCSWCQVATGVSAVTLAITLPEAIKALRGPQPATAP